MGKDPSGFVVVGQAGGHLIEIGAGGREGVHHAAEGDKGDEHQAELSAHTGETRAGADLDARLRAQLVTS